VVHTVGVGMQSNRLNGTKPGNWKSGDAVGVDPKPARLLAKPPTLGRGLKAASGLNELQKCKDCPINGVGIGLVKTRHGVDKLPNVDPCAIPTVGVFNDGTIKLEVTAVVGTIALLMEDAIPNVGVRRLIGFGFGL